MTDWVWYFAIFSSNHKSEFLHFVIWRIFYLKRRWNCNWLIYSKKKDIVAEAIRAASHEAQQPSAAVSAAEIKKEPQATAGTSSSSTNASQSTSSASPTVVTAVKSEPNAGKILGLLKAS